MFTTALKHLSAAATRTPTPLAGTPALTPMNSRLSELFQRLSEEPDPHRRADGMRSIRSRLSHDLSVISRPGTPLRSQDEAFNDYVSRNFLKVLTLAPRLLRVYGEAGDWPRETDQESHDHLSILRAESARTVQTLVANPQTGLLARVYAALVDPVAHRSLGISAAAHELDTRSLALQIAGFQLSEREALLIRDFVHPDTGTFNVWRCVENLARTAPHARVHDVLEPVSLALLDAVCKVYELGSARATGPLYKGMVTNARLLALQPGRYLHVTAPTSTTASADQTYVGRATAEGKLYDSEFIVKGGEAIDATAFHPPETLDQREAILLPQRLRVESVSTSTRARGARGQPFEVREIRLKGPAR